MPYLDVGGGRLFYEDRGGGPGSDPGSEKRPLVFVHGLACDHADWRRQADHFAPSRRVVCADLRGHGRSGAFASGFDIETYAADLAALVDGLDLAPAVLAGHSMGCRPVLECARRFPERVAALALVDGSRLAEGAAEEAYRATRAVIDAAGPGAFVARLFSQMFTPASDPALRDRIVARAARLPARVGESLAPSMVAWDAAHMEETLRALRVPLLVVQSTYLNTNHERVPLEPGETIPWLELVARCVPGAHIETIHGVGHFAMLEAAERVNGLLDSLLACLR